MKNIDTIIANAQKLMINEDFWSKVESVESSRTTNGGKVKGSCAEIFRNNSDVQQMQMETNNRRKKTGNPVLDLRELRTKYFISPQSRAFAARR